MLQARLIAAQEENAELRRLHGKASSASGDLQDARASHAKEIEELRKQQGKVANDNNSDDLHSIRASHAKEIYELKSRYEQALKDAKGKDALNAITKVSSSAEPGGAVNGDGAMLQRQLAAAQDEIAELQLQQTKAADTNSELQSIRASHAKEIYELKSRYEQSLKDARAKGNTATASGDGSAMLQARLIAAQEENAELRRLHGKASSASGDLQDARASHAKEIYELKAQHREELKAARANGPAGATASRGSSHRSAVPAVPAGVDTTVLQQRLSDAREEVVELQGELAELHGELKTLRAKHAKEIYELKGQRDEARQEAKTAQNRKVSAGTGAPNGNAALLKQQLEAAEEELSRLRKREGKATDSELKSLQASHARELDVLKAEHAKALKAATGSKGIAQRQDSHEFSKCKEQHEAALASLQAQYEEEIGEWKMRLAKLEVQLGNSKATPFKAKAEVVHVVCPNCRATETEDEDWQQTPRSRPATYRRTLAVEEDDSYARASWGSPHRSRIQTNSSQHQTLRSAAQTPRSADTKDVEAQEGSPKRSMPRLSLEKLQAVSPGSRIQTKRTTARTAAGGLGSARSHTTQLSSRHSPVMHTDEDRLRHRKQIEEVYDRVAGHQTPSSARSSASRVVTPNPLDQRVEESAEELLSSFRFRKHETMISHGLKPSDSYKGHRR